jgi:predicted dehydrogenase
VDASESITVKYKDGKMAVLNCTVNGISDRRGVIYGSKGFIVVENINNFESVTVYDASYKPGKTTKAPKQITGYEYEVYSCFEAIDKGELECWEMPHEETIRIMKQMDELRAQWGIVYPFESGEAYDTDNNGLSDDLSDEAVSKPIQAVIDALEIDDDIKEETDDQAE